MKLALVRPDFAHLWPGITIDHSRNIKAACLREKRFVFNGAELSDVWQELKAVQQRALQNAGTLRKQKSLRRSITGAAKKNVLVSA